jgi:hypothetical protein
VDAILDRGRSGPPPTAPSLHLETAPEDLGENVADARSPEQLVHLNAVGKRPFPLIKRGSNFKKEDVEEN